MLDLSSPQLQSLSKERLQAVLRVQRVFGATQALQYLNHLNRLTNPKPWFVFVDSKGARFFTHFVKLEKVVKNPRSITGNQKYIANAKNDGVIF